MIYRFYPPQTGGFRLQVPPGAGQARRQADARMIRRLRLAVKAATGKAPTTAYLYYAAADQTAHPAFAKAGEVTVHDR